MERKDVNEFIKILKTVLIGIAPKIIAGLTMYH